MIVKNLYTMDGCLGKPPLISGCLGVAGRIYTSTAQLHPQASQFQQQAQTLFPCVCWRYHYVIFPSENGDVWASPYPIRPCLFVMLHPVGIFLDGPRSTRASAPFPVTLCPPSFAALANDGHHDRSACTEPEHGVCHQFGCAQEARWHSG